MTVPLTRTHRRRIVLGTTAAAVLLALALSTAGAQGVPGTSPNKCLTGKTKCVDKKVAGLLKCREKCQKEPLNCGATQTACEDKVIAKFDGGTKGEAASCFGKLEAKQNGGAPETICTTTEDLAAMEAKADFKSFEHAITLVVDAARQNEGWLKHQLESRGQSRRAAPSGPAAPGVP